MAWRLESAALFLVIGLASARDQIAAAQRLFIALAAQLISEVADITRDVLESDAMRCRGCLLDTAVTMALPTLLLLVSRLLARKRLK